MSSSAFQGSLYWQTVFWVVWGNFVHFWTGTFVAASVVYAEVRTAAILQFTLINIFTLMSIRVQSVSTRTNAFVSTRQIHTLPLAHVQLFLMDDVGLLTLINVYAMSVGAVQLVPFRTQALEIAWRINAAKFTESPTNKQTLIHIRAGCPVCRELKPWTATAPIGAQGVFTGLLAQVQLLHTLIQISTGALVLQKQKSWFTNTLGTMMFIDTTDLRATAIV